MSRGILHAPAPASWVNSVLVQRLSCQRLGLSSNRMRRAEFAHDDEPAAAVGTSKPFSGVGRRLGGAAVGGGNRNGRFGAGVATGRRLGGGHGTAGTGALGGGNRLGGSGNRPSEPLKRRADGSGTDVARKRPRPAAVVDLGDQDSSMLPCEICGQSIAGELFFEHSLQHQQELQQQASVPLQFNGTNWDPRHGTPPPPRTPSRAFVPSPLVGFTACSPPLLSGRHPPVLPFFRKVLRTQQLLQILQVFPRSCA